MRDASQRLIRDVNDGIIAVAAAKRELKLRTEELIAKMKEDGHDRAWGVSYMEMVSKAVDETTAKWATQFFSEAWPEEGTCSTSGLGSS